MKELRIDIYLTASSCIFIILLLIGCNKQLTIDKLSEHEKHKLFLEFQYMSVSFGGERDTSSICIKTDDSSRNKVNEYYFTKDKSDFFLTRVDTQYFDLSVIDWASRTLRHDIKGKLIKCRQLKIKGISTDMANLGIPLKIYLDDGSVRLYVLNPARIKTERFKAYFSRAKKVSENWYSINE